MVTLTPLKPSGLQVGDHLTELINCTGGNLESESPVFS